MLILALESSAKPVSVAVYKDSELLGQIFQNTGLSHSRTLMSAAESLLSQLGIKPADLDRIAVANGPGSFTGVRIGVSAAIGLAFGLDIPVCGVSTLEAMAYQTDYESVICPVMDARNNQVYNALFKRDNGKIKRLREDRVISIDALADDLKSIGEPFMPVGDGTDLVMQAFSGLCGLSPTAPPEDNKYQSARGVAPASLHISPVSASQLEPVYLRPSQAERNLRNKTNTV